MNGKNSSSKPYISHVKPGLPIADSASKLSQQYGGRHTANWVNQLPSSWVPYIQLARLSPPVGVCLVLFPHLFGFLHGTLLLKSNIRTYQVSHPPPNFVDLLSPFFLLVTGSFFLSNAIHGWNDLIDAPYDALVARTRQRPIVRGAVSKHGALLFTVSQAAASYVLLATLLPNSEYSMRIAAPSILANLYYPWAKRHTHFAQYVLGICLAWGVVVGTAGVLEAERAENKGFNVWLDELSRTSTACLAAAAMLWTVIYDTIYAFQDREDDVQVGLKSTAVLFGKWTKVFLSINLISLVTLLLYFGVSLKLGMLFFAFAIGGCVASLGAMILQVDLSKPQSCWWWFRYGFWLAGGSIGVGLLFECLL